MKMNRRRWLAAVIMTLALAALTAMPALAAKAGWNTVSGKTYYYVKTGSTLKKVTGLYKINGGYYYFDKSTGVMKKGWVSTASGFRYFRPTGAVGTAGRMYVGFHKINGHYYYFRNSGLPITGFWKLKLHGYYFNPTKKLGILGQSMANKKLTYKGDTYYFGKDQFMAVNKWVNGYYFGSDGKMLKDTVTPDGYHVGTDGKRVGNSKVNGWVLVKGKYHFYSLSKKKFITNDFVTVGKNTFYLNAQGTRVTGWQKINGNQYYFLYRGIMAKGLTKIGGRDYYFNSKGVLQKSKTVDGYTTDSQGVVIRYPNNTTNKRRILIVAGHGQGDGGAASTYGSNPTLEYLKTREFAKLIYQNLKTNSNLEVEYYQNGSTNYDLYQQHRKTLMVSSGVNGKTYLQMMTGAGNFWKNYSSKVIRQYNTNTALPKIYEYDYVLEVHFNAKVEKTTTKDGRLYGTGFYVNSYKKDTTLERNIVTKFRSLGLPTWGGGNGMFYSTDLVNAKVCTEEGVNYGLLETCFIDDADDMAFYESHKNAMAKAAAQAISAYYS